MRYYQGQGLKLSAALEAFDLTRHQYYYRPGEGTGGASRPGRQKSTHTLYHQGEDPPVERPNEEVVEQVRSIQQDDDLRCGYKRMKAQLELRGYQVNAKKVYRLMKEENLLLERARKVRGPYVTHRLARPVEPLTLLEMDIKMIWVEEHRRYAFVLTILDTFTRVALYWQVAYSIRWADVQRAWTVVIEEHLQPADMLARGLSIEVRSDNGPQFLAQRLREFFAENHLCQVFTHPYTPQENGHVESFHSILSTALGRELYWTMDQLEARLAVFYEKYNNERVHSATAYLPPRPFWQAWEKGLVVTRKDKRGKLIFRLTLPRYQLSGSRSPEGVSRSEPGRLDAGEVQDQKEVSGAVTSLQPSVQLSPSVVSR